MRALGLRWKLLDYRGVCELEVLRGYGNPITPPRLGTNRVRDREGSLAREHRRGELWSVHIVGSEPVRWLKDLVKEQWEPSTTADADRVQASEVLSPDRVHDRATDMW